MYGMRETAEAAAVASELLGRAASLSSLALPLRDPVVLYTGCGCR